MAGLNEHSSRIKNDRILLERIEKFVSPLYFADVNMYSKLYKLKQKIPTLLHYKAPGRITYDEATNADVCYTKVQVGESFGPAWSTHWFKIDVDLSSTPDWKHEEVRLRWNSGSEAMVWIDGKPEQGLTGGDGETRTDYILTGCCHGDEQFTIYIEMAANGLFGVGNNGMINPPNPHQSFTLSLVELVVLDQTVNKIIRELNILMDMAKHLSTDSNIRARALQTGCDVVNCFQPMKETSSDRAKHLLDQFFGSNNGMTESLHTYNVHGIGHCHIDTAWLWPYAETKRKCARSWSSVIELMKRYPKFTFACSQAVQFDWIKENYPSLYNEICLFVSKGNFIPIGGTWVEMDGNIPSGESFIRQFLYGQRFFKKEFGKYCEVFWLPDTFGYSAQLPQIIQQSGIKYFLTQKISWSLINKFPHNNFHWQGIDGSSVLTHFPPADTYESKVSFHDVLKTCTQNKDKGFVSDGMLLYGYGDGGGGPTEDMIENLERLGNIPGLPRVQNSSPVDFFHVLEKRSNLLHTWVGELYLELHQGTFTTQALIKKRNRQCEIILHNTEMLRVWAKISKPDADIASSNEIEIAWRKVLLNQFHDVLPGTCIRQVVDDAEQLYLEVIAECKRLDRKHEAILQTVLKSDVNDDYSLLNFNQSKRREVIALETHQKSLSNANYQDSNESSLVLVEIDGMSYKPLLCCVQSSGNDQVTIQLDGDNVQLENKYLCAIFTHDGQMTSCKLKTFTPHRECIRIGSDGNLFCLFTDIPLYWDAWDVMPYNSETREILQKDTSVTVLENGPLRVSFQVSLRISNSSSIAQVISLDVTDQFIRFNTKVDWHENRKILKVEFPLNVHTDYATYDIQCGHIRRPTHRNTSWDEAKYEVCGHKWVDLSEYGFGIALLNDCKYGFCTYGNTLQMSLLRSSKAPDDKADMGMHAFSYAFMPHAGSFQDAGVIQQAYNFNNPLQVQYQSGCIGPNLNSMFRIDNSAVVIETVKLSEENENQVVVRLYESFGSHFDNVVLNTSFEFVECYRMNLLEERDQNTKYRVSVHGSSNEIGFSINPFEIVTLCFKVQ